MPMEHTDLTPLNTGQILVKHLDPEDEAVLAGEVGAAHKGRPLIVAAPLLLRARAQHLTNI